MPREPDPVLPVRRSRAEEASSPRGETRKEFERAGLTYDVVTRPNLMRLRRLLEIEMRNSGVYRGTLRPVGRIVIRDTSEGRVAWLQCGSDTFEAREAVTFNLDGTIGFAGWADDENVEPFLRAFRRWVGEMVRPDGSARGPR